MAESQKSMDGFETKTCVLLLKNIASSDDVRESKEDLEESIKQEGEKYGKVKNTLAKIHMDEPVVFVC